MDLRAVASQWRQLKTTARARARILVVDDEPAVRRLLQELFADECVVETADSAEAAWPLIERSAPGGLDLAVVDKNLPAASGLELLAALRERDIPSLLITGYPSVETVEEALAQGAVDYLSKPFDLEHVQSRVRALLDRSAQKLMFERVLADVHGLMYGADRAAVERLKRCLEATRRHIDAADGVLLATFDVEPATLERALGAPPLSVRHCTLDDVYEAIGAGAAPRVVVLGLDGSDVAATVRQLKAADASLDLLLLARTVDVARVLAVVHAGAADFVLPTVEGLPILARRVRRLAERVRRQRLYLGLLSALYRSAVDRDPDGAEAVLAIAAPAERRLVRNGLGGARAGESATPSQEGDDDMDDLPTLERIFSAGRPS